MTIAELVSGYDKAKHYLGDVMVRLRSTDIYRKHAKEDWTITLQNFTVYDSTAFIPGAWKPQFDLQKVPIGQQLVLSDITLSKYRDIIQVRSCAITLFHESDPDAILKGFDSRRQALIAASQIATSQMFLSKGINLDTIFHMTHMFDDYLINGAFPIWIERRLALSNEAVQLMIQLHYEPAQFQENLQKIIDTSDLAVVESIVQSLRREKPETDGT